LVLLVAITLNFLLPRLMPGSPLGRLAGEEAGNLSAQDRARIIQDAGLDKSLGEQYVIYLGNLLKGDFGYSFQQKKPITTILLERLPWTLLLTGTALMVATGIGAGLGSLSAWRRGRRTDFMSLSVFIFLQSLPSFWVGMILVAVFAVQLGLFPTFGARDVFSRPEGLEFFLDVGHHLVLPVTTLVLFTVSEIFLTMRYSMLSVLGEDFVTVARAKGLHQHQVLFGHAVRNAVLPVATVFMLRLGEAFAGATVIETVFSYPGVGRLIYDAVLARDYPLLQGAFLVITLSVVAANLFADLLYPILDPRVARRA
jgi:peptide/nickel transport system permease protein